MMNITQIYNRNSRNIIKPVVQLLMESKSTKPHADFVAHKWNSLIVCVCFGLIFND